MARAPRTGCRRQVGTPVELAGLGLVMRAEQLARHGQAAAVHAVVLNAGTRIERVDQLLEAGSGGMRSQKNIWQIGVVKHRTNE